MKKQKGISTRHNPSVRIKDTTAGITLIALVITIIVLLILAGVSISMVIGNNGVLNQASTAGIATQNASEKEQVELAYLAAKTKKLTTDGSAVDAQNLRDELVANGVINDVDSVSGDTTTGIITVKFKSGNVYTVENELVTIDEEASGTTGGGTSLASQITAANYGDYVDYEVDLGIATVGQALSDGEVPKTDWRIFYEDETNIYLIASDYLPASKFPSGVFGADNGKYNGYWATDSTDTSKLSTSGTVTTNNNFLFTKLSSVTTTNYNYQAVSTILDTSKWKGFAKQGYVDNVNTAVIGSPTVEMWMASWNDRYDDTLAFDANTTGYQVGLTADSLSTYIDFSDMQAKEGWSNTLYYPHASTSSAWNSCYGYWLASPSAGNASYVMNVDYNGYVDGNGYGGNYTGVRPVVSLKSGITATKDANGVWQLD